MLFGEKRLYNKCRKMKLGKGKLPVPLEQLRCWVNDRYSINVLNVVYDRIDLGPHEGRPRLNLIIETKNDYDKMHKDWLTPIPSYRVSILNRFAKIIKELELTDEYNTRDVHLIFDDFSDEAMGQASAELIQRDKRKLMKEFKDSKIWEITGISKQVIVFYLTEQDIKDNEKNGVSDLIKQQCFERVKRYDEFNYFKLETFPITFDSKENLDKNYNGSFFYYFK